MKFFLDKDFPHASNTQKSFLSRQSSKWLVLNYAYLCVLLINAAWDLLRIDTYGFKAYYNYFFHRHPGYFASPLRISGSAVESLFSQFKHNSGRKLDACTLLGVHT